MNYQKIYNQLIEKRRKYPWNKSNGYCEYHHIIPKCIGGYNTPRKPYNNRMGTNLIGLTAQEHFLAHRLLERIYPNSYGLTKAVLLMSRTRTHKRIYAREYQRLMIKESKISAINLSLRNKKRTKLYHYKGKLMTVAEISKMLNINRYTLYAKLKKFNGDVEKALSIFKTIFYDVNGKSMSLKQISDEYDININTLRTRIKKGLSIQEALTTQLKQQRVKYEYNGKSLTLKEWAQHLKESLCSFKVRFYRNNKDIKYAIESSKNFGKLYQNISPCQEYSEIL